MAGHVSTKEALSTKKMNSKLKNITKICASNASYEFRETSVEFAEGKHVRILEIFSEALRRQERQIEDGQMVNHG